MVVQADPEWCGGVSELVKICTLASVHGVNVIPHGHSLHAAMHVVASQPVEICPLVEYLIQKMSNYYYFEKNQLKPVNGMIELPNGPGFGIEFDESKIADMKQRVMAVLFLVCFLAGFMFVAESKAATAAGPVLEIVEKKIDLGVISVDEEVIVVEIVIFNTGSFPRVQLVLCPG